MPAPVTENKADVTTDPRPGRRFTLADMHGPVARSGQWRRLPTLTLAAVRLVGRAAPRELAATIVLQIAAAGLLGAQLLVGRRLLTEMVGASSAGTGVAPLLPEFGLLMAATLGVGLIGALTAHQQRLLAELVGRHAFDEIITVSGQVEYAAFEDPVFYDQLARAKASGMYRPVEMVTSVTGLVAGGATSAGVAFALFAMHPLLVPLVFLAGLPVLITTLYNSRQAYSFEYALTPRSRDRMYLMEVLTTRDPAKEVRVFGAGRYLRRRYDELTEERLGFLREFLRKRLQVAVIGATGTSVGMAIALGSLVALLAAGRIDVATTVAAGIAMQVLASRLRLVVTSVGSLVEAGMFLDDFMEFLRLGAQHREKAEDAPAARPPKPFTGVRVEGVSFTYPQTGRTVLEDVSLEVGPGEVVALVGENGSGKTTLVKLICQLYRPQRGRVVWSGEDVTDATLDAVREDITVLFQDYIQYHLKARDNIALGRVSRDPAEDAIVAAARQAGAHEYVEGLPDGYDTRLGRQFYGGHELSVGQWQRLALARAFFRGGPFLIMDEPTASLDPRAEHDLFEQMRRLARGRSVLLISHRFSSVREADRIYVLHQGRLIESGSHEELMARDGHYAELFRLQARAYLSGNGTAPVANGEVAAPAAGTPPAGQRLLRERLRELARARLRA